MKSLDLDEFHLELRVDALVFDPRDKYNVCIFLDSLSLFQHVQTCLDERISVHSLLDEHAVAGAAEDARVGRSRRITDDDHLGEGPILANVSSQSADVRLCENYWRVQVEGRADDAIGDGLALSHRLLRVLEHVEEELLVREVLLRRNADIVHGDERVERVLAHGALRIEQEPISSIDDRSMDIRDFSS